MYFCQKALLSCSDVTMVKDMKRSGEIIMDVFTSNGINYRWNLCISIFLMFTACKPIYGEELQEKNSKFIKTVLDGTLCWQFPAGTATFLADCT